MANIITFQPSADLTVTPSGSYVIEGSTTAVGPWVVVATIPAVPTGTYWNPTASMFEYRDENPFRPYNTWYHVIDMDVTGKLGRPSDPFMTHIVPYFVPGVTPFGAFDSDFQFQQDADKVADFVRKGLGEPVMEVHLSSTQIYSAFEKACLEYSSWVNQYQAKSTLPTYLGSPTGTLSGSENKFPKIVLSLEQSFSDPWAGEANVNSSLPFYTASIQLNAGQQWYDVPTLLSQSGQWDGTGHIRIRNIYHNNPLGAYRFFGTTSGLNYLNSQFRFESFTPETLFYLLPVWEDILRGMQFKTSNTVRRSNYSFDLHNNNLRLFPTPAFSMPLWLNFTIDANPQNVSGSVSASMGAVDNPGYNGVANLSNVPFGNIKYSELNSISKTWIWNMTMAVSKEIEGLIRSKFSTVPIPNGDVTLNGPQLIQDAKSEMEALRAQLKEMLEETTYQKLMEREAQTTQYLMDTWKGAPLGIFVG